MPTSRPRLTSRRSSSRASRETYRSSVSGSVLARRCFRRMAGDVSDRRSSPAPHDDLEHSSKLTHANNNCTNGTAASDKTTVLSTAAPGGHDEAIDLEARPLPSKRPTELFDQSSRNSPKRILTVMACLQMLLFISFVDQSSVAAILPVLAQDLNAADSINWTGTAFVCLMAL